MLGLYLSSLFFAFFMAQVFATKYSITFTSDEYEEDETGQNEPGPLVFHLDKNSLPPALLNQMEFNPYLVLADLPEEPRAVDSQEHTDTVLASKSVIDFLLEDPLTIVEHKKFSQIESILHEIMEDSIQKKVGADEVFEEIPKPKIYAYEDILVTNMSIINNSEMPTSTATLTSTIPYLSSTTSLALSTGVTSVEIFPTITPGNITTIGGYENSSSSLMPFKQPKRRLNSLPFFIKETGWGEFNLKIECFFIGNAGKFSIEHELTFEDDAYAVDYTVDVPHEFSHLNSELSKYFDLPWKVVSPEEEMSLRIADLPWIKSLALIDEDMMTDVVQMILNDPAVQRAIENHPRREQFFMFITQLPDDLLMKIQAFLKLPNKNSTKQERTNFGSDATHKDGPVKAHNK
ncbi:BAP_1a_G0050980.mRNA.1.CDS.1 [Saccharomyces cerevisiae]|nr:BAP_1a_G0050980.mRNA.1.CDS.1 [Saccharomyces cerevisiae]CAI7350283.1 BAP_1a_G0050980.mRNA.1.CDS.1 [Saccharomyces cerevisiae]